MAAHVPVNIGAQILVCSACTNSQEECPACGVARKGSAVRFCLAEWPARKCEACCSCIVCIASYAQWPAKVVDASFTLSHADMMHMAVLNYLHLPVRQFDVLCSMDFDV